LEIEESESAYRIFAARYTRCAQKCMGYSPSLYFNPGSRKTRAEELNLKNVVPRP
jgi:hypothetical protein